MLRVRRNRFRSSHHQRDGFAQLGATSRLPRHRFDSNNQLIDNFSWKFNKHDVKVGFRFSPHFRATVY